jgi:hypothetical protein
MNLPADPVRVPMKPSNETDTRLGNPWLTVARVTWVVLVALALGLVIAGIPLFYSGEPFRIVALVHEQFLGISTDFWLIFYVTRYIFIELVFFATAVLIFRHKSDDWMAMLVSVTLVTHGLGLFRATGMLADDPVWGFGTALVELLGDCLPFFFLYLFPDGRFVPRWTWLLAIVYSAWFVVDELFPASPLAFSHTWPESIYLPFVIGWVGSGIFSQVYRYVRVSGPLERQQVKWVVFGMVGAFLGWAVSEVLDSVVTPVSYDLPPIQWIPR